MPKVILVTAFNRPQMLRRSLDALGECYGIADYTVCFSVDIGTRTGAETLQGMECLKVARTWEASPRLIASHSPARGIDENKLWAFPQAFKLADYVIHVEDDILMARDALRFLEWGDARFRDDPTVLSVSAYQKEHLFIDGETEWHKVRGDYGSYRGQGGFACWGWATWKDRWKDVIGDESAYRAYAGTLVNGRFDWWWKQWMADHDMSQIHPYVARCQNLVGAKDTPDAGVNSNDEFAMDNFNPDGIWLRGDVPDVDPSVWRVK